MTVEAPDGSQASIPPRPSADAVLLDARQVVTCAGPTGDPLGVLERASVAWRGERIVAVGPSDRVAFELDLTGARTVDAGGGVVLPGFVDCHTHLVFAGSRVEEFAARTRGDDLGALGRRGAAVGIRGTAAATRRASVDELVEQARPRLRAMIAAGTTTVEVKSGYGLEHDAELRMLEAVRRLGESEPVDVVATYLGAHALPPERPREEYVAELVKRTIPTVAEAGLARFCDAYCDEGYFTVDETIRVLEAAVARGLAPKLHIDAYSHTGIARAAAVLGCVSVDHLNYTTAEELGELHAVGAVAVAMPGLDLAAGHPRPWNARPAAELGMPVALATDLCPGCWLPSMQEVVALACRRTGLSVEEAVLGATLSSARAIGRGDEVGSIEPGKLADLVVLDLDRYEELAYRLGVNSVRTVIKRGTPVRT